MHEPDSNFPVDQPLIQHAKSAVARTYTPRRIAVCKHCRLLFAGEIDEFGKAKPGGVCHAKTVGE